MLREGDQLTEAVLVFLAVGALGMLLLVLLLKRPASYVLNVLVETASCILLAALAGMVLTALVALLLGSPGLGWLAVAFAAATPAVAALERARSNESDEPPFWQRYS